MTVTWRGSGISPGKCPDWVCCSCKDAGIRSHWDFLCETAGGSACRHESQSQHHRWTFGARLLRRDRKQMLVITHAAVIFSTMTLQARLQLTTTCQDATASSWPPHDGWRELEYLSRCHVRQQPACSLSAAGKPTNLSKASILLKKTFQRLNAIKKGFL